MARVMIYEEICKGCGLCIGVCPKKILEISKTKMNSKGYPPTECIDQSKCIACTFCAMICPDVAIEIKDE